MYATAASHIQITSSELIYKCRVHFLNQNASIIKSLCLQSTSKIPKFSTIRKHRLSALSTAVAQVRTAILCFRNPFPFQHRKKPTWLALATLFLSHSKPCNSEPSTSLSCPRNQPTLMTVATLKPKSTSSAPLIENFGSPDVSFRTIRAFHLLRCATLPAYLSCQF